VTQLTTTTEQQGEASKELSEHPILRVIVSPLKVIVSPFKTLKGLAQKPNIKGLIWIVGLVLLTAVSVYFAYASKVFLSINGADTSFLASNAFTGFILFAITQTTILFFFSWIIYAVILHLVMRLFGAKGGSWRPLLVLVGYTFSILIIQSAVSALLVSTLPELHFGNLSTWPPSTEDEATIVSDKMKEVWFPIPAFHAVAYLNYYINVFDVWMIMLSTIIVRAFSEVTWNKALMISVTAFLIRLFLRLFVGF